MPTQATDRLRKPRRPDPAIRRLQNRIARTVSYGDQPIHRPLFRMSHAAHVVSQQAGADSKFIAGIHRTGSDIDDRARPRTVPNRESAGVHVHSIDGGGIESAEQTLEVFHVKGIGERHPIEFQ
jgi:hypothetical protein